MIPLTFDSQHFSFLFMLAKSINSATYMDSNKRAAFLTFVTDFANTYIGQNPHAVDIFKVMMGETLDESVQHRSTKELIATTLLETSNVIGTKTIKNNTYEYNKVLTAA